MARRNKHADAHAQLLADVKGVIGHLTGMAVGYLGGHRTDDYGKGASDAYLRSAHCLAKRAGLLDQFPKLVFWRAWVDEWMDHPSCDACGAWRCDTAHPSGGRYRWQSGCICTKCALEASLAPAAEAAE